MRITHSRFTVTVLVVLACVLLVSLVSLLVVNVPSIRAGTCGTIMAYTWKCRHSCSEGDMYPNCPGGCPHDCYHCYKKNVQHWVNPVSDEDLGSADDEYSCSAISNNCPTFCFH
jgi:hypothetical protein